MTTGAPRYLGGALQDTHHLTSLQILNDGNGVLVHRVEGNELGTLVVVPQCVLLRVALLQNLQSSNGKRVCAKA